MMKRIRQPEAAPPWGFGSALSALIAMFLSVIVGTTIATIVLPDSPSALMTGWAIGMILTILFVMVTRRRTPEQDAALRIGAEDTQTPLLLLLMGMIGVAVGFDLLSWVITGQQTLAASELFNFSRSETTAFGWVIALLFMVMLQPIGEELIFRGILFPTLRAELNAWTSILMCAGFHAAFHFLVYGSASDNQTILLWYGVALPFLDGVVFTMVRASTGSTRASMVAHAAFGLFAVLKVFTFA